ncbi:MAG: hypothetical protein KC503_20965 [Myxococcales bacterium]|nr:hypothetical protein [Myxococcales bacterium]
MKVFVIAATMLACGCSSDPSDLVIRFSTDLNVPTEADEIKLTAKYATVTDRFADVSWSIDPADANAIDLPGRVRLIPNSGGVDHTIEIELRALLRGSPVLDQQASLTMPSGGALLLEIALGANCKQKSCPSGRTCVNGECSAIARSHGALPAWNESNAGELQTFQLP